MNSIKEYTVKIRELSREIEQFKKKILKLDTSNKEARAENNYLRRRLKELILSKTIGRQNIRRNKPKSSN